MPLPRISCILVHESGRVPFTEAAATDFLNQTYVNKQLVIALSSDSARLAWLGREEGARLLPVGAASSRGAVLDASRRAASGPLICRWESTCRHHTRRLEAQFGALSRLDTIGSCLSDQLYYDASRRQLHCLDFRAERATGDGGMVADTLLCWRRNSVPYEEDGSAARFFQAMGRFGAIAPVEDSFLALRRAPVGDAAAMARYRDEVRRHALSDGRLAEAVKDLALVLEDYEWDVDVLSVRDASGRPAREFTLTL